MRLSSSRLVPGAMPRSVASLYFLIFAFDIRDVKWNTCTDRLKSDMYAISVENLSFWSRVTRLARTRVGPRARGRERQLGASVAHVQVNHMQNDPKRKVPLLLQKSRAMDDLDGAMGGVVDEDEKICRTQEARIRSVLRCFRIGLSVT